MSNKKINLVAPINKVSYGIVGCNILKALDEAGVDVSLFIINENNRESDTRFFKSIEKATKASLFYSKDSPCLRIWHQFCMTPMVGRGKHIGMPIFELDNFTPLEKHHLESLDELFVCSNWAKKIVNQQLYVPAKVVPLGVDANVFKVIHVNKPRDTIFLNIGKWEYRKGHDVLLECFNAAFEPSDNVQLWCLTESVHMTKNDNHAWANKYLNSKMGRNIKILPRQNTQDEIALIINAATCGVFPSRAEGFNLGAIEMMACGKPNIITDYSAHTEYSNKDNSLLVSIDSTEPANDGVWFIPNKNGLQNQGNWATIGQSQKDQIISHMRNVYNFGVSQTMISNSLAKAKEFTWQQTTKKIIDGI